MIHIEKKKFIRGKVKADTDYMYLFSDNAERTSFKEGKTPAPIIPEDSWYKREFGEDIVVPRKSTALIRGLNNAYPITTSFLATETLALNQWSDYNFEEYKRIIDSDIDRIKRELPKYKGIKVYDERFGDNKGSQLIYVAPKCYKYLEDRLKELGINNMELGKDPYDPLFKGGPNFITNPEQRKITLY